MADSKTKSGVIRFTRKTRIRRSARFFICDETNDRSDNPHKGTYLNFPLLAESSFLADESTAGAVKLPLREEDD